MKHKHLASRGCAAALLLGFIGAAVPISAEESARPKVALVLEGGGALGLAHVGVIKVMEEVGIPVDIVVGTSMGAIVGGLYSLGYDSNQLEKIALNADWVDLFLENDKPQNEEYRDRLDRSRFFANIDLDHKGIKAPISLLSGRKILSYLDRYTLAAPTPVQFNALPRQYRAVATDVATGEKIVLDHGSLADAMRASMSIPGVFSPYFLDGRYLVDGGVVDNLPVDVARSLGADLIIAINLVGGSPFSEETLNRNPLDVISRSIELLIEANVREQLPKADYVLSVDLIGYDIADFAKTADIVKLGIEAAEKHRDELGAFKLAALGGSTEAKKPELLAAEPFQRVVVEGVADKDRKKTEALFAGVSSLDPDDQALKNAMAALEKKGIYEAIRLQTTQTDSSTILHVRLKRRAQTMHALRLGLYSASTYSGTLSNTRYIAPGVVLRGLTTEDSRLSVDAELFDSTAIEISFLQPIQHRLFLEAFFTSNWSAETYISDSAISYLNQTGVTSFGFNLGVNPVNWVEISMGLHHDWIGMEELSDIRAGDDATHIPMARACFALNAFDSPIFPMAGAMIDASYAASLSSLGATRWFEVVETEGRVVPPLGIPFIVELGWKAGSDLSEFADDIDAAPAYYKPDIANRRLFPGPLKIRERIGSHVGGIGLTARYQLNWASRTAGFPALLTAHAAAGAVLQNRGDLEELSSYAIWNATIGLGLRINDAFGISARVGLSGGFGDNLEPFFALDLGSIEL